MVAVPQQETYDHCFYMYSTSTSIYGAIKKFTVYVISQHSRDDVSYSNYDIRSPYW
jgi:hypothetical protein